MNAPIYPPIFNPYASAVPANMQHNMDMYDGRSVLSPPYASSPGNMIRVFNSIQSLLSIVDIGYRTCE
jgi:hypothetical protein